MPNHFAIEDSLAFEGTFEVPLLPFSPRLAAGDLLIVFARLETDIEFLAQSKVAEVTKSVKQVDGQDPVTVQQVDVEDILDMNNRRSLVVHAGSLEKVYRYLDPARHFTKKIVKLSKRDFKTLIDGTIHMDRAVFRTLFSSLPLAIQTEFVREHADILPLTSDGAIRNYGTLAPMLVKFVSDRLTEPLTMLSAIAGLHVEIEAQSDIPALRNLTIAESEDGQTAPIQTAPIQNVAFGQTCAFAQRTIGTNRLFAETEDQPALFREALTQLSDDQQQEGALRWNDPIF